MKNTIKIALFTIAACTTIFGANETYAQVSSGQATLNVHLATVRTIIVNPNNGTNPGTVDLRFNTPADYQNGVDTTINNHLEITSTEGFKISVKVSGDLSDGASHTIPASTINVTAISATGAVGTPTTVTGLTTTDQSLVTSATTGTLDGFYNVKYAATGGSHYINTPSGVYTTTVTYTITAP